VADFVSARSIKCLMRFSSARIPSMQGSINDLTTSMVWNASYNMPAPACKRSIENASA
jgi:hypothetical protein